MITEEMAHVIRQPYLWYHHKCRMCMWIPINLLMLFLRGVGVELSKVLLNQCRKTGPDAAWWSWFVRITGIPLQKHSLTSNWKAHSTCRSIFAWVHDHRMQSQACETQPGRMYAPTVKLLGTHLRPSTFVNHIFIEDFSHGTLQHGPSHTVLSNLGNLSLVVTKRFMFVCYYTAHEHCTSGLVIKDVCIGWFKFVGCVERMSSQAHAVDWKRHLELIVITEQHYHVAWTFLQADMCEAITLRLSLT